jgi:quinol monooxygenase YgiN
LTQLYIQIFEAWRRWHAFGGGDGVVFSIIKICPALKQRNQAIEILRSVQDLTRPSPGCLGCWLSDEDPLHNHIRYAEQWETEEALHDHIRSHLYLRLLAALELSKQLPEVTFYYTAATKGFELIENLRGRARAQAQIRTTNLS